MSGLVISHQFWASVEVVCPNRVRAELAEPGREEGLDLRGKNFARRRRGTDAQRRRAEGSLQAPRPTIEGLAATRGERKVKPG